MKQKQRGFTLIELMVVIGIIVLLSTLMVANYRKASVKARDSRRAADLEQIRSALEIYYADNDMYPPDGGLSGADGFGNLSLEDPKGNTYQYHPTVDQQEYTLCADNWEGSPPISSANTGVADCVAGMYGVTSP